MNQLSSANTAFVLYSMCRPLDIIHYIHSFYIVQLNQYPSIVYYQANSNHNN